mmetsp:Transcript_10584/g.29949  ORF Transcript_10584/g.29949 Transcript_10584/m.29949 type:complete len:254 (-) Transcript_10584:180-941(-)
MSFSSIEKELTRPGPLSDCGHMKPSSSLPACLSELDSWSCAASSDSAFPSLTRSEEESSLPCRHVLSPGSVYCLSSHRMSLGAVFAAWPSSSPSSSSSSATVAAFSTPGGARASMGSASSSAVQNRSILCGGVASSSELARVSTAARVFRKPPVCRGGTITSRILARFFRIPRANFGGSRIISRKRLCLQMHSTVPPSSLVQLTSVACRAAQIECSSWTTSPQLKVWPVRWLAKDPRAITYVMPRSHTDSPFL